MVEISICPICQFKELQKIRKVVDHSISKEEFQLQNCSNCSLVITSPRPTDPELASYYQSDKYISHSGRSDSLLNWVYLKARTYSLQWKLRLIRQLNSGASLLDIGCGTGEFLNEAKQIHYAISGVEPNLSARTKAENLLQISINNSINEVNGTFDIITLWHVLEHLPQLNETMSKINSLAKKGSTLVIALPNHESLDAVNYKEFWAAYDVPRHLWHFTQKSMGLFLQNHGFVLEQIKPMKLDAFYVSMLSEKYKSSANTFGYTFRGLINGLKSNYKARSTGQYSSLIYIAKK